MLSGCYYDHRRTILEASESSAKFLKPSSWAISFFSVRICATTATVLWSAAAPTLTHHDLPLALPVTWMTWVQRHTLRMLASLFCSPSEARRM